MDGRSPDAKITFDSDIGRELEAASYPRPEEARDLVQRWLLRRYYDGRSSDSPYKKVASVKPEGGLKLLLQRVLRRRG